MEQKQKTKVFLDGLKGKSRCPLSFDFPLFQYVRRNKGSSLLFSKKAKTSHFFTEDSGLYLTPAEYKKTRKGGRADRIYGRIDGLYSRNFEKNRIYAIRPEIDLSVQIKERYAHLQNYAVDFIRGSVQGVSMAKMWNISVIGAVIFGMFTMTMVYRYLGESVSAKVQENQGKVAGVTVSMDRAANKDFNDDIDVEFMTKLLSDYQKFERDDENRKALEKDILDMVKGYPIEKMAPLIAKQDRKVAALIVAIAKKESSWGIHAPVLHGQDCHNYWGYRAIREKMGTGGHTCFDNPEDAVTTVAKRIEFLVSNEKLNTPAKMKVWKCGYDCSWDSKASVQKWIDDVDYYFKKLDK